MKTFFAIATPITILIAAMVFAPSNSFALVDLFGFSRANVNQYPCTLSFLDSVFDSFALKAYAAMFAGFAFEVWYRHRATIGSPVAFAVVCMVLSGILVSKPVFVAFLGIV